MSDLTVHTLRRAIAIQTGGDAAFQYLAASPNIATPLTPASITIESDGAFLSATWRGVEPIFLNRIASARDLALQLDSEIAALSLQDVEPDVVLASSILHWRGIRLLLLGPGFPRTALALALFSRGVDIEGDWACRLAASRYTALPRSVRWDARLLRAFPEVSEFTEGLSFHSVDSYHGLLKAWSPTTTGSPWICRDSAISGIVVTDTNGGGRSLARRIAPDFVWGHLMAARMNGNGGATLAAELRALAGAIPALKLSVGDLAGGTHSLMEFFSFLDARSSAAGGVAPQKRLC